MGNLIEQFQDFITGDREARYLFFGDELHAGTTRKEDHTSILHGSGRQLNEIQAAGRYLLADEHLLIIDSRGSMGLYIESCDPARVIEYIKSFPDSAGRIITC